MIEAADARPIALTDEQRRIVHFGDGPVIVIAGAGTGKTRVIVERVRWLLDTYGRGSRDAVGRLLPDEPQLQPSTKAARASRLQSDSPGPIEPAQVGLWPVQEEAA